MYCLIILGADKTTVSVATGHVEYHPLYLSIGNLHGCACCGHRNSVIPIGFLAIPESDQQYDNDPSFQTFKKQLYHNSIAAILCPLKPAMTMPVCRAGVVDVQLIIVTWMVQIVKGCFKDMLVDWIGEYLVLAHGEAWAKEIIDEVDHWNNSKALMKVYLPAVAEYIPEEMTLCLASFLCFCHLPFAPNWLNSGLMPPLQAPPSDLFDTEKEDESAMDGTTFLPNLNWQRLKCAIIPATWIFWQIDLDSCPKITSKVDIFRSAVAMFYAPSNNSGICVLVITDEDKPGFKGMSAA
ncbi:hypothetical protein BT96DRAFT_944475 [Gymnopus androsaceus JB14]|uniref:Uncharacterized protein n=1 Tax=Gymnopus androsaceus JB14 TaxID=1447944 RepID=A0A6A4H3M0_9AGAR|nr:hypothetical protein BT96DRAFT_944475 [Gymnopus androsaceus JB14]